MIGATEGGYSKLEERTGRTAEFHAVFEQSPASVQMKADAEQDSNVHELVGGEKAIVHTDPAALWEASNVEDGTNGVHGKCCGGGTDGDGELVKGGGVQPNGVQKREDGGRTQTTEQKGAEGAGGRFTKRRGENGWNSCCCDKDDNGVVPTGNGRLAIKGVEDSGQGVSGDEKGNAEKIELAEETKCLWGVDPEGVEEGRKG